MTAIVTAQEADPGPGEEEGSAKEEGAPDTVGEETSSEDTDEDMSVEPGRDTGSSETDDSDDSDETGGPDGGGTSTASAEYADLCSDSGPALYKGDCKTLQPGFTEKYKPKYGLWADGDLKERFIHLPGTINASNGDFWEFPVGTILYKTFRSESRRFETRIIKKVADAGRGADWTFVTWGWKSDGTASLNSGELNFDGTGHNIPTQAQCASCHRSYRGNAPDPILGFSAIQLNHEGVVVDDFDRMDDTDAATVLTLSRLGSRVSEDLTAAATIPGSQTAQQALGYLHANCGHCHTGAAAPSGLELSTLLGASSLTATPIAKTALCSARAGSWLADPKTPEEVAANARITKRVELEPSAIESGAILFRMQARDGGWGLLSAGVTNQMPPLATNRKHDVGVGWVRSFITELGETWCIDNAEAVASE
jgi:hypothetical protein